MRQKSTRSIVSGSTVGSEEILYQNKAKHKSEHQENLDENEVTKKEDQSENPFLKIFTPEFIEYYRKHHPLLFKFRFENKDVYGNYKPKTRGWIHGGFLPLALSGCIVLLCLAPTWEEKLACAIYLIATILLFGGSATYHIFAWGSKIQNVLRRLDHANIFILIAATNTVIGVSCYEEYYRNLLLIIVWSGAGIGIIINVITLNIPRVIYVLPYLFVGLIPLLFIPQLWDAGIEIFFLIWSGGIFYIAGTIFYTLKKPTLSPRWFGFHEFFHLFTVIGYTLMMIGCYFAVLK